MSVDIEIRGLQEVLDSLENLPEELFEETREIFKERTFAAHRKVTSNLVGGPMYSRTGLLRKSIRTQVSGNSLDNLRAGVYSAGKVRGQDVVYAPIHEFGGTVRAKRAYKGVPGGPYLNIPTRHNKTPAGVTRMSARDVFNAGGYIARMRSGVYGVFVDNKLMYTLHKEVRIKARLGMRDAVEGEIPTLLSQIAGIDL